MFGVAFGSVAIHVFFNFLCRSIEGVLTGRIEGEELG